MDFTPAEFPTTGVSEKEFIDKMIALAKAGEDEMEHLKCVFYTWAVFYEADEETTAVSLSSSQMRLRLQRKTHLSKV